MAAGIMIPSLTKLTNCAKQQQVLRQANLHAARSARLLPSRFDCQGLQSYACDGFAQHATRVTAVAVSDADLLSAADPALDSFIDQWLSKQQDSTSSLDSSSSSSGSSSRRASQSASSSSSQAGQAASWQSILGPVTVTLDSLSTLEDGDDMFALSDSLCHLASSLQDLQVLAGQLQQQPDAAAEYSEQISALLTTAAKQVDSLQDTVLLNLLAIAAVLLTSSASSAVRPVSSTTAAVQSAAAVAVRSTLHELWQRPDAADGLNAAQLTSLSVVLYRLNKMGVGRQVPSTLLTSAFQQLQQQVEALTPSQLAVCFWCLSSSRIAPPAGAVAAALERAAAALATQQIDVIAVLRTNAALINLRGFLGSTVRNNKSLAAVAGATAGDVTTDNSRLQQSLHVYMEAVAQYAVENLSSRGSNTNTSSSNGSSKGSSSNVSVGPGKVIASVAQLFGTFQYSCQTQQQLLVAVIGTLQAAAEGSGSSDIDPAAAAAAAAAGHLLPYWHEALSHQQQQKAVQAMCSCLQRQRQQQQPSDGARPSPAPVLALLDSAVQCSTAAVQHNNCGSVLDLVAQQLLSGQQQQRPSVAAAAATAAGSQLLQCYGLLLRLLAKVRHRSQHCVELVAAVVTAAAAPVEQQLLAAAVAAADAAVALCVLQPEGWVQQLQQLQMQVLSDKAVAVLPVRGVLQTATAATAAGPAAAGVAAAAVQRLLQPAVLNDLTTSQAVDALILLSNVLSDTLQQQQQSAPAAAVSVPGSSAVMQEQQQQQALDSSTVLQQCLQCMLLLQRDARGIRLRQIVPTLSALLQLQQLHTQQQQQQHSLQWQLPLDSSSRQQQQQQQVFISFVQLQQEVLAAVALQLEDSAHYLTTQQLSESVRQLALLSYRPTLALAAVAAAASNRTEQFSLSQLTWMLWGFTKLRFTRESAYMNMLRTALARAVRPTNASKRQQQGVDTDGPIAAAAAAPLHQLAALLWVSACKGYNSTDVVLLIDQILHHSQTPSMPQLASVAWSFAHMGRHVQQQQQGVQQQQQQVLEWVDCHCSSSSAEAVPVRSIVNITWAMNKLGHEPSAAAQSVLVSAALQQQQRMTPAELSCFVHCLNSWNSKPLTQQHLQQLEQQMLSSLQQQQQAVGGSSSSGWDGPALCSCCWGLVNLGLVLQHETLDAVQQQLLDQMPVAAAAAMADVEASSSRHSLQQYQQQRLAAPSAQDLAMYGAACRQSNYQPEQLLHQFRNWLLLQLARKGPAALLPLSSVKSPASQAAVAAARWSAAVSSSSSSSSRSSMDEQQQRRSITAAAAASAVLTQHSNVLVCVLMFLRQVRYADRALLQRLEVTASREIVTQQVTGQQLVMMLSSFRQLGLFPAYWWQHGMFRLLVQHVQQLSAGDCVELLGVISAWQQQQQQQHRIGSSTRMRQYILPQLAQRLLGQVWTPKSATVEAAAAVSNSSSSSGSRAAAASSSSSDTESDTQVSIDNGSNEPAPQPAAAAAAVAVTSANTNLVAQLSGPEVVTLLRSISHLHISDKLLQRQALRRLQQVWDSLDLPAQIAAAHAAVKLKYDATAFMDMQQLSAQIVSQQQQQSMEPQQQQQHTVLTASAATRMLWVFGNLGKHPGAALLGAALTTVADAAASSKLEQQQQQQQQQHHHHLPLREISNALYSAAVLHELSHPAAVAMLQQLLSAAAAGQLLNHPLFMQQAPQLAACLLASQIAAPAAGAAASDAQPSPVLNPNPWLGFSRDVHQRLLETWRRKIILKSQCKPVRLQQEVVVCLRQLGLRCKANAVTPDGCVCIDVAATSPQGEILAIELLGAHNAASNTQRPLGPARLKWRLLAARGYRVVVINAWQWQNLDGPTRSRDKADALAGPASSSAALLSEKMRFLQSRLAGPAAAGLTGQAAAASAVVQSQGEAGNNIGSGSSMDGGEQASRRRINLFPKPVRPVVPMQQQR